MDASEESSNIAIAVRGLHIQRVIKSFRIEGGSELLQSLSIALNELQIIDLSVHLVAEINLGLCEVNPDRSVRLASASEVAESATPAGAHLQQRLASHVFEVTHF